MGHAPPKRSYVSAGVRCAAWDKAALEGGLLPAQVRYLKEHALTASLTELEVKLAALRERNEYQSRTVQGQGDYRPWEDDTGMGDSGHIIKTPRLRAWFPWGVMMIIALVLMATGSVLLLVAGILVGGSALMLVPRPRKLTFSPGFINNWERSEGIPLSDFSQWGMKPPDRLADNETFLANNRPRWSDLDTLAQYEALETSPRSVTVQGATPPSVSSHHWPERARTMKVGKDPDGSRNPMGRS
jgi:hypothetical protein